MQIDKQEDRNQIEQPPVKTLNFSEEGPLPT